MRNVECFNPNSKSIFVAARHETQALRLYGEREYVAARHETQALRLYGVREYVAVRHETQALRLYAFKKSRGLSLMFST